MMRFHSVVMIILLFYTSFISSTTINGRFTILQNDSSNFSVQVQLSTNTGTEDLGGATIVFSFDTLAIGLPQYPVKNVDYFYHAFCGGNYSSATITRPTDDKVWINIDLPFINNNNGTIVSASPEWTDVVTIHFEVINPNGNASLSWLTNSLFWGIYDADNSTLWENGEFYDLNSPLPVELIAFNATLLTDENILLEWKTASSLNNLGFEIEKSYDDINLWEKVGFVKNQGDPLSLVEYSFIDTTTHRFPKINYRLKSIDNDGSYEYSYIIEIDIWPKNFSLSQNYPNPFNPSTIIKFSIPEQTYVQLKVYDMIGNEVATLLNELKTPGNYEIQFNAAQLASGIYIYSLKAGSFVQTKKMILLK